MNAIRFKGLDRSSTLLNNLRLNYQKAFLNNIFNIL